MSSQVVYPRPQCSCCASTRATPASDTGLAFCSACARKLAERVFALEDARVGRIWRVAVLPAKARATAARLSSEQAEVCADLAFAFHEIGMLPDALENALFSLTVDDEPPSGMALWVVFSPKLLAAKPTDVIALIMSS